MYITELKLHVLSSLKENDPYKESKEIQLKHWCYAFLKLFSSSGPNRLGFFLDVLEDEECWEETDSIHRVKLKRRMVAKKMIEAMSWKGLKNPLDEYDRYQVACWCALQEDITDMFERLKQQHDIRIDSIMVIMKKLVNRFNTATWSDPSTAYWSHIVGGCASRLNLKGKHLYEYGLELALDMNVGREDKYRGHVEAVEFFWNKIKLLPETVFTDQQKHEIIMRITIRAASSYCCDHPEIFEFCLSQINPDKHPEFLKREFAFNHCYGSFIQLQNTMSFDKFQNLFDYFRPADISEDRYSALLTSLKIERYAQYYANEAVKCFLHIWQKEGFYEHRSFVLKRELCGIYEQGAIIVPFVRRNYMEAVWVVLNEARAEDIITFMNSAQAVYIHSILESRQDRNSVKKFLSYNFLLRDFENLNINGPNGAPQV